MTQLPAKKTLALAMLIPGSKFVLGQQVIFIPATMGPRPMMMSPHDMTLRSPMLGLGMEPPMTKTTMLRGDDLSMEPPCRQRRLEPFRQEIRDQCNPEAFAHCAAVRDHHPPPSLFGGLDTPMFPSILQSLTDEAEEEGEFDPFLRSLFLPFGDAGSARSGDPDSFDILLIGGDKEENTLESIFDSMMGLSLHLFDAAMIEAQDEGGRDDAGKADDGALRTPEETAEYALDVMVTSLFQRAGASGSADYPESPADESEDREEELRRTGASGSADYPESPADESEDREEELSDNTDANASPFANEDVSKSALVANSLSTKLSLLGQNMLDEFRRRRLSEGVDPRTQVKERLARRLTEYRTDLFIYPDGTVTLYTALMPSLKNDDVVLGMGSQDVDKCIMDRYEGGDLQSMHCRDALEEFLSSYPSPAAPILTHSKSHPTMISSSQYLESEPQHKHTICVQSLMNLLCVVSLLATCALCTGFLDVWNLFMSASVAMGLIVWGLKSLFIAFPILLIMDRFAHDDEGEDDDDKRDEDYVMMADCDDCSTDCNSASARKAENSKMADGGPVRKVETFVFVGVPVQVV